MQAYTGAFGNLVNDTPEAAQEWHRRRVEALTCRLELLCDVTGEPLPGCEQQCKAIEDLLLMYIERRIK